MYCFNEHNRCPVHNHSLMSQGFSEYENCDRFKGVSNVIQCNLYTITRTNVHENVVVYNHALHSK